MENNNEYGFNVFNVNNSRSNTAVLEKTEENEQKVNIEEAKERMQRNLDKILHYELFEKEEEKEETKEIVAEQVDTTVAVNSDDLMPSSTTMQFGDGDIDNFYQDLPREKEEEQYKLNAKGKLLIVLYSLAVIVIMSLIVLNTGIIAKLKLSYAMKNEELSELVNNNKEITAEIENISNNDYISSLAENDYQMIIK